MLETTASVTIAESIDDAFDRFTSDLGEWWPPEYTWSKDELVDIGIEPGVDGMCYETGPHGFRCDFGRVLDWQPGVRLVFTWQISPNREPVPDPNSASEVEVQFEEIGDGRSRVQITHRHFERHGEGAEEYCEAMGSAHGWSFILERFAD